MLQQRGDAASKGGKEDNKSQIHMSVGRFFTFMKNLWFWV
jgi:hypothetical protein